MSNEDKCESKSEKPENKCSLLQKLFSPTIRLTVSLREPDEEFCSVFNYISLLSEEKRNRRSEREKIGGKQNPDKSEDVEELKRIAAGFEEKYGNGTSKKKKKKKVTSFYNYTELASGYDESDSFIDNSEAFDEALPDEMETLHGGYYVNCGQLEFKKVETVDENSDAEELRVSKKKTSLLKSDDSNDDDDFSKSESSSSESDTEDIVNETKKLPEENDQKTVECESTKNSIVPLPKNQEKLQSDKSDPSNSVALTNGDLALKKKKKYKKRRIADDSEVVPKKKGRTVKILLEEKRVLDNDENVSGFMGKSVENYYNSINDVIESVVNAARNHSEDSRDSTSSCSETKSIDSRTSCETEKENHAEEMDVTEPIVNDSVVSNITKEQIKLPENLPLEVINMVLQLKAVAQTSESGARTFFNTPNNCKLLSKLDEKTRSLSTSCRIGVYTYLASFLPCSKDTLMKRARQFLIDEEDKKIGELLNKLKSCIDKVMPSLFEKYSVAYQNAVEKSINGASKNNQFDENNSSQRLPSRKFVWTDEIRNHVHELAMCRMRSLNLLKPKKVSVDELLKDFLEKTVKPLWPDGWMDTTTLLTEARVKAISLTSKKAARTNSAPASAKKSQLPVPSSNNLSPPSVSVSTAYNLLTNSLALQSLSMQYSQPDSIYSAAAVAGSTSTSIPYRSDLSLISSANAAASTLPFSIDVLSRIAGTSAANQAYPITPTTTITSATNVKPYAKSVSPTKKQTTSLSSAPSSTSHRASTSVASSVAGVATTLPSSGSAAVSTESRKSAESSSSKSNDMFKIDSLIGASAKLKKEHHQLNHVSQYNKHYSHKVEKKKMPSEKRENSYISSKSPVNLLLNACNAYSNSETNGSKNHNNNGHGHASSNHKNVGITSGGSIHSNSGGSSKRKQGNANCNGVNICSSDLAEITATDLVLDLSPNKIIKIDKKSEVMAARMDHHLNYKNESNMKHAASANVTAKDHNYWSSVKEEVDVKEEKCDPIVCSSAPLSDNFKNQNGTAKPVHISRKQRILQESIKSGNQEAACPPFKDGSAKPQISLLPNHVQNDSSVNVPSKSHGDKRGRSSPAIREEKRTSLLDGKQVMNHNKRPSVTFNTKVQVFEEGKKPRSVSLIRYPSADSFFGTQQKTIEKMVAPKKSRVVRSKSLDEKKRRSPLPGREEKRSALPKDLKITETTTATDFLSKIINDSLQESSNHSRRSPFVNSTYDSLERKLDRDSREKEKNYEAEIKLLPSLKESQPRPPEKAFVAPSAERKQSSSSDRVFSQKTSAGLMKNLSVVLPRSRIGGEHRPDKKSDRDARDKERSLNCESKESQLHHAEKKSSAASADRKVAGGAPGHNDDVINDLMLLNTLGGHSIPRRMEQLDAAYNAYNSNANELNGAGSEALNHSSLSTSHKPRTNISPFQDEFRKHILKSDPGNS